MDRINFLKKLGLGAATVSIPASVVACVTSEGINYHSEQEATVIHKKEIVDIEFLVNGKPVDDFGFCRESYKDWVYTDFTLFDKYLEEGNYERVKYHVEQRKGGKIYENCTESEILSAEKDGRIGDDWYEITDIDGTIRADYKPDHDAEKEGRQKLIKGYVTDPDGQGPGLYDSLRWYFLRWKHQDIRTWDDHLIDSDKLTDEECIFKIQEMSDKFLNAFPFENCTDRYYKDWSLRQFYLTCDTLLEYYLTIEDKQKAFDIISLVEQKYLPYKHKEFKKENNPFQSIAYFLNKYELYEEAYKYASLDQINRTDGTRSRMLMRLKKQLNKVGK